jgi:hypothetical protein
MIVAELLVALGVGLLVVFFFSLVLGRRGPWVRAGGMNGLLWFFLVVFLGAWAVGAWADPVGPLAWGVSWLPFLFGALVFALLLAAVPDRSTRPVTAAGPEAEADVALGLFFWFLLLALVVAILFGSL